MSTTDEYGLCVWCGGHGATFRIATAPEPGMNPRQLRSLERRGEAHVAVPCQNCDGQDRATPMMEARAEGGPR